MADSPVLHKRVPSGSLLQAEASAAIVKLNVGGCLFQTTRSTLLKGGDNFFSALLSGRVPAVVDHDGAYFIDRPGRFFAPILEYLQTDDLRVTSDTDMAAVEREAAFYCIHLPPTATVQPPAVASSSSLADAVRLSSRLSMESARETEEEKAEVGGDVTEVLLLIPLFNRPNAFDVYAHPLKISTEVCQLFMDNSIAQLEQENRFSLLSWKTIAKVTSILLSSGWVPISVSFTNYLMDFKSGLVFTRKLTT